MIDIGVDYPARDRQLRAAAAVELGCTAASDASYVTWLIDVKRPQLAASSWRQYRCAAAYVLEKAGTRQALALARKLRAVEPTKSIDRPALPRRTSAFKSKTLPQDDIDKLLEKLQTSRSPYREQLCSYIRAALLTGLRPCEWPSVRLQLLDATLIVTIANAKANDLRAHSPERTLLFDRLPASHAQSLRTWLAVVKAAGDDYPKLIRALGDALRWITRKIFPRRRTWPTLYTMRHLFAARAKDRYADDQDGLAIVAAILGHSSDATATHHYARRGARGDHPIPRANPAEVALVRTVFKDKFDTFLRVVGRPNSAPAGSF